MGSTRAQFENLDLTRARVEVSPAVVASYQGDRAVLLDYEHGEYFGLNAVGTSMWKAFADGKSLDDVVTAIRDEYDAETQVIQRDLRGLLAELSDRRMVGVRA